ncbi:MAG: phage tail assembly chaperone [Pseudomonadota bacterium]
MDWKSMSILGLRVHRLSPEVFWSLSPAEFGLILGHENGAAVLSKQGLDRLEAQFPDEKDET